MYVAGSLVCADINHFLFMPTQTPLNLEQEHFWQIRDQDSEATTTTSAKSAPSKLIWSSGALVMVMINSRALTSGNLFQTSHSNQRAFIFKEQWAILLDQGKRHTPYEKTERKRRVWSAGDSVVTKISTPCLKPTGSCSKTLLVVLCLSLGKKQW